MGRYTFCSSGDPRYIDAVKAMTDSSYLSFTIGANGYECRDLVITNASRHLR
jgi:hypothetical protein